MKASILFRLFVMGVLMGALLVPTSMIWWLSYERSQRFEEAAQEVMKTWAGEQTLFGPVIAVPYQRPVEEQQWNDRSQSYTKMTVTRQFTAYFLPESLDVDGVAETEIRMRGLFKVPVYTTKLKLSGRFRKADVSKLGVSEANFFWDQAVVKIGLTDLKGLRESIPWKNGQLFSLSKGIDGYFNQSIEAPLGTVSEDGVSFDLNVVLAGSRELKIMPAGSKTTVHLKSSWPSPSFSGGYLPGERQVTSAGFDARWKVLEVGRHFPQSFVNEGSIPSVMDDAFGLRFLLPVDIYQLSTRSVKYANLFIFLTFLVFFLFEVLAGLRIHPVQYLMVGLALAVFYLLLLALSEHIGFTASYAAGAAATVGLICLYVSAVLKRAARVAVLGSILTGLFAYLYVVLRAEDYALLLGSLGLFAILAVVMMVTRKIDWYAMEK
jgi:inner membrane protein